MLKNYNIYITSVIISFQKLDQGRIPPVEALNHLQSVFMNHYLMIIDSLRILVLLMILHEHRLEQMRVIVIVTT